VEDGLEEVRALQSSLENALHEKLGFAKERRQFTPHLTIGRVHKATPEMNDVMEANSDFEGDSSEVDELVVFASYMERQGPRYAPLGHATLGKMSVSRADEDDEF
jgi:2'-5' RNA ligase